MNVCGAATTFSAIMMSDFKIFTVIIRKRKMTRAIGKSSDIGLDRAEVNF